MYMCYPRACNPGVLLLAYGLRLRLKYGIYILFASPFFIFPPVSAGPRAPAPRRAFLTAVSPLTARSGTPESGVLYVGTAAKRSTNHNTYNQTQLKSAT